MAKVPYSKKERLKRRKRGVENREKRGNLRIGYWDNEG